MRADLSRSGRFTSALLSLAVTIPSILGALGCARAADGPRSSGGAGGGGSGGQDAAVGGGDAGGPPPCASVSDCPGEDGECQRRTCADGRCGVDPAPRGKPVSDPISGDCKKRVCDGEGGVIVVDDDQDPFVDGDPCSADLCVSGAPVNPPAPAATECTSPGAPGARYCDGNGACVECLTAGDCLSNVCIDNRCVAPACGDGVMNGEETDVDCGGPACVPCAGGMACLAGSDCQDGVCHDGRCRAPSCIDGMANGAETDVDCGGPACPPCATGKGCAADGDCLGGRCSGTTCLPSCTDTVQNGSETDVDCGGPACVGCATGMRCAAGSDCLSRVCGPAGTCAAPSCGDGVVNTASEACDDGNASNTDGCLTTCAVAVCGDGFVWSGVERCDDGNSSDSDACPRTCEPARCGDGFVYAGVEACDDGNRLSGDGCSPSCLLEACGDGVVGPGEQCDDGNFDNTDDCPFTCRTARCGDGFVRAFVEGCDDANSVSGDGCSATCAVEPGYVCRGTPSVCSEAAERRCNDAQDNDLDGDVDCDDPDCAVGCDPPASGCASGQVLWVQSSTEVPRAIPDRGVARSGIAVPVSGTVQRVTVGLDIAHTFDADLEIALLSPAGSTVELSYDNGGSGDDYRGTLFDMRCTLSIKDGRAPFRGCFRPEESLAAYNGAPASGTWTLRVADDSGSDRGTLTSWTLALCVAP